MTMGQTWSSASSGSSTNHSHDKATRMSSIIEETERIEAESEELLEAIRLAKGEDQVRAGNYSGNKWNFLKRAPAVPASKLEIEYPTTFERKVWQARPAAKAATKNISRQVTERREKKPTVSAQGQEHYKDERSNAKRPTKELKLMEVATARANQFDLMEESKRIKAQLALAKAAEKRAHREAYIFMKEEKQEIRRELKAAAKERKRLLIRQRAEEKIAKIAKAKMKKEQMKKRRQEEEMAAMKEDLRVALALAKGRKSRKTKEAGYNSTAYQKKTKRGHDMPNYQKKTQGARFLKNEKKRFADADKLKDARDDRDEEATDLSRVKNEFIQWKRQLCALEKEEREEADGMGTIEKIFQCSRPMWSLLPVCVNRDSLHVANSEQESKHNTLPRRQQHKQHRSDNQNRKMPSHRIPPKKFLSRSELEKYYAI